VVTLLVMGVSLLVTRLIETISGAWAFILEASAGLGLVLILRWFWWRVNAWSEIVAMVAPILTLFAVRAWWPELAFPQSLFVIVAATTAAWLLATYLTPPTDRATLRAFYERVHPGGPGWQPVAAEVPQVRPDTGLGGLLLDWAAGVVLVYATLFASGRLLFGRTLEGLAFAAVAAAAAYVIARDLGRRGWDTLAR
jgi:hypothetical protein